jgi:hypothetical protein
MIRATQSWRAVPINRAKHKKLWGSPGAPKIMSRQPWGLADSYKHYDIVVSRVHNRKDFSRLLHYLGKHVPFPQKSLWSPDTPVLQDRHMYKLTTLDVDAFKYWFGVNRALIDRRTWKLLWRAGLLPPTLYQHNPLLPRPIFDKEELYRYFLANRKPLEVERKIDYLNYQNSIVRTDAEKEADRPKAPWL